MPNWFFLYMYLISSFCLGVCLFMLSFLLFRSLTSYVLLRLEDLVCRKINFIHHGNNGLIRAYKSLQETRTKKQKNKQVDGNGNALPLFGLRKRVLGVLEAPIMTLMMAPPSSIAAASFVANLMPIFSLH